MLRMLFTLALSAAASAAAPEDIRIPAEQGELAGTYIAPATGKDIVLILPGSGPTDRDGNNPMGVRAASYRLLAEALAQQGIGSIRADKRGLFGSTTAGDANAVTIDLYAEDARRWISAIRQRSGRPCIWVAGHSEGGLTALTLGAAARPSGEICGIITLSTFGRPLGDVLRTQLAQAVPDPALRQQANDAVAALEAGRSVDAATMPLGLRGLFAPQVQNFLKDMMQRNPVALAHSITLPMLIMQGDNDMQITVADAQALHQGNPASQLALLPEVSHVLKRAPANDRAANLATYGDPDLPLAPGVTETIVRFITTHPTGGRR